MRVFHIFGEYSLFHVLSTLTGMQEEVESMYVFHHTCECNSSLVCTQTTNAEGDGVIHVRHYQYEMCV